MNNRYLEIDSTFRNREMFPNPGYFEIPISQSGRKSTLKESLDPVCLSAPLLSWTSNNLSTSVANVDVLSCVVEPKTYSLSGLTDTLVFIIHCSDRLQQDENYYSGAIVEDAAFLNRRRIKSYKFLGSFTTYDRAEITLENSFPETFTPSNLIKIYDPSDLSSTLYPILFVPNGNQYSNNAYCKYLIYNETLNEYRPINYYDKSTRCLYIETGLEQGPISLLWSITDNYSIRKEIPTFPKIGESNPVIVSSTLTSVEINTNINVDVNNSFIRILPDQYNYSLTPPENDCRRIMSYNPSTKIISVYPSFKDIPAVGNKIEILRFSYDNLNPFVYTGSVLSQQELVCYEIDLLSLILPNEILSVFRGGLITDYQYVYVELSNICNSGQKNILYSNNPNSTRMLFRVPIFDNQDAPVFCKIGGGQSQTIKFKPNDNLLFNVTLPNGETVTSIINEKYSPYEPEHRIQISAMFSLKRIL